MNFCTRCGSKLALSAMYCGTCGYPVSRDEKNQDNIAVAVTPALDNQTMKNQFESNSEADSNFQPTESPEFVDIGAYGFLETFKEEKEPFINPIDKWNEVESGNEDLSDRIKIAKEHDKQAQEADNELSLLADAEIVAAKKHHKKLIFRAVFTFLILSVILFSGIQLVRLLTPSEKEIPFVFVSKEGYLKAYTSDMKSAKIIDEYKDDVVFQWQNKNYFSLAESPLKNYGEAYYYKISNDCKYIAYVSQGELKIKDINRVLNPLPFLKPETKTVSENVKTLFEISYKGRFILYTDESNVIKYYDKNKGESFELFEKSVDDLSLYLSSTIGENLSFNFIKEDYLVIHKKSKIYIADLKKSGKAEDINENEIVDITGLQIKFEKDGSVKYIDYIQSSLDLKNHALVSVEFKEKSYKKRIVAENMNQFNRIGDYIVFCEKKYDYNSGQDSSYSRKKSDRYYYDYKGEVTDIGYLYSGLSLDLGLDYPLILGSLEEYNPEVDKDYINPDYPISKLSLTHFYSFETGQYHEIMAGDSLKFIYGEEVQNLFVPNKKKNKLYYFGSNIGEEISDEDNLKNKKIMRFDISKKGWLSNPVKITTDKGGDSLITAPLFGYTKDGDNEYMLAYGNNFNYKNLKILQGYEKRKLIAEGSLVELNSNEYFSASELLLVLENKEENVYNFYKMLGGVEKIASIDKNEINAGIENVEIIKSGSSQIYLLIEEEAQYNLYIVKEGKKILVEKNISYSEKNY